MFSGAARMSLAISPDLLVALTGTSASQLKQLLSSQPREILTNAEELSQFLLHNGLLTPYQAGHIAEGRGDGLIVGQYIVLDELGHGSVGLVYRVRHRIMGRLAALKVFTPDAEDSENFTRFMREIQATAERLLNIAASPVQISQNCNPHVRTFKPRWRL